jgi:serine/threonine-protein kinase
MAEQPTKTPLPQAPGTDSFGNVAIRLGFITETQLAEAMKAQAAAAKAGLRKRLGEILIKKGYLTPEQFEKVLKSQTSNRKRIGDYELISKLGEGGMGAVFKARQVFMDRVIALKILSPKMAKNKNFRDRFVREARAVAKLNHPHIVAGIDVGSKDGYCYFAMEYVDGETLGQLMQRKGGKLEEPVALEYVRQIALALHHAHQNNLLHRDVKPDNALLDRDRNIVKLADLGLARSSESEEDDAALTQAGQAIGTPFYISPEQARGLTDLTPATDLYSLGASLFHLLTGQVPFDGTTAAVIMTRHLTDTAPGVCKLNPAISAATEKIVMKCMQKKPSDRYPSAMALVEDIERVQVSQSDRRERNKSARQPPPVVSAPAREKSSDTPKDAPGDTPNVGNLSSVSQTRAFRRRRRPADMIDIGMVLFVLIGLIVLALIMARGGKDSTREKRKPEPGKTSAPALSQTADPPAPMFAPPSRPQLAIERNADGTLHYKTSFETDVPAFLPDLAMIRPGQNVERIPDAKGSNYVLKLARCREDGASMVRMFLPRDTLFSSAAVLKFKASYTQFDGNSPELTVVYSTPVDSMRIDRKWNYVKPELASTWVEMQVPIGKEPPARQHAKTQLEKLPFIAIYAGLPGQEFDAFIDDFEIIDNPASAAAPAKEPASPPADPAPAKPPQPAPDAPKPEPAAPPAPQPKAIPKEDGADALNRAL